MVQTFDKLYKEQATNSIFLFKLIHRMMSADSELSIAILQLFTNLTSQFPKFVTGVITRESIEGALKKKISAEQIIRYLCMHAHPMLRKPGHHMPMEVLDQIRIWDEEFHRRAPDRAE
ncbi:RNA polymerase II transcription factor B 52 kDa subunit [Allomyces arbusculus]|nr:RNA polymerase II transcription factor B 52 kDa subunit [Allomyces arbusculus]